MRWQHEGRRKGHKLRCPHCGYPVYYPQNTWDNIGGPQCPYPRCPWCGEAVEPGDAVERSGRNELDNQAAGS